MQKNVEEMILEELFRLSKKVDGLEEKMDKKFEENNKKIFEVMDKKFEENNKKIFGVMDQKFDETRKWVEAKFDETRKWVEAKFDENKKWVEEKFDENKKWVEAKFDQQTKEMAEMFHDTYRTTSKDLNEMEVRINKRTDFKFKNLKVKTIVETV